MKILIVEDNKELSKNLQDYLDLEGYKSDIAENGNIALELLDINSYSLVLLDLNLPLVSGEEVIKSLRNKSNNIPILVLSAKNAKSSIVENLLQGADDYVTKPFSFEELTARIKAVIRREKEEKSPLIKVKRVEIDTNRKKVISSGSEVSLSPKEYYLLEYLALNRGKVQNRTTILENVWGESDDLMFSQTVDVHIAYIRKKLGKDVISTAIGGYLIE